VQSGLDFYFEVFPVLGQNMYEAERGLVYFSLFVYIMAMGFQEAGIGGFPKTAVFGGQLWI
jgi:hypothetical protein